MPACAIRKASPISFGLPRKTLEMERRILVLLRNAGCNAVPHPNDFVYDANPHLEGPYTTEDRKEWTYGDQDMLEAEPYLVMEAVEGQSLAQILERGAGQSAVGDAQLADHVPGGGRVSRAASAESDAGRHDLAAHLSGPQAGEPAHFVAGPRNGDRPGRLPAAQSRHRAKSCYPAPRRLDTVRRSASSRTTS